MADVPEADAQEQAAVVDEDGAPGDGVRSLADSGLPLDASEADALEQAAELPLEDDGE